ncbi:MAG: D-glycero-beta-D-manno-heptose 1-phosphate adenylyltransferase [Candidatus Glassbacteria bacterium]
MDPHRSKILSIAELNPVLEKARAGGKKVVFTNGCFDILHRGHVYYLERARSLGDLLVVGLNSDASVTRIKGPGRPVFCELDRAQVLSSLTSVDFVVIFDEDTPLQLIERIRPDVLVKGGDWREDDIVGAKEVKQWGGTVVTIDYLKGYSTSRIIEALRKS